MPYRAQKEEPSPGQEVRDVLLGLTNTQTKPGMQHCIPVTGLFHKGTTSVHGGPVLIA